MLRVAAICVALLLIVAVVATALSSRYLSSHADGTRSQLPPAAAPSVTSSALVSMQQCATTGGAALLARFVAAFNQNDQTSLEALLVDQPLSANDWIAAVTNSTDSPSGDVFADSQSGFLHYIAQRHQQGERLQVSRVLDVHPTWLPGYMNVVADLQRTADDLPSQQVRVVAMLSCAEQQIGSWSLGAVVDTSNVLNLTGDALIADTLRQRPLHIGTVVPNGICPADAAHRVDPILAPGLGGGPFYVVLGEADASGVFHLQPDANHDGWTRLKTVWAGESTYSGPIFIHGGEIGGTDALRFGANPPLDIDPYFSSAPMATL